MKTKEKPLTIRRKLVWSGVSAAAKRIGVTHNHLSQCLSGQRASRRVLEQLRRHNVTVEQYQKGV